MIPLALSVFALAGCGGDGDSDPPIVPDTTPPENITDLRSSLATSGSITLNWTAPGDDANEGSAHAYDIRFATAPISPTNWQVAPRFSGTVRPSSAGLTERVTVDGLLANTLYYFVVSSEDEVGNRSGISNVHQGSTAEVSDVTPPATVMDLAAHEVSSESVILTFTAPGDDGNVGTAFAYDLRYLDVPVTETNWLEAEIPDESPIPRAVGTREFFTVPNLDPGRTYYFAMIVLDEVRNKSGISNVIEVMTEALPSRPDLGER